MASNQVFDETGSGQMYPIPLIIEGEDQPVNSASSRGRRRGSGTRNRHSSRNRGNDSDSADPTVHRPRNDAGQAGNCGRGRGSRPNTGARGGRGESSYRGRGNPRYRERFSSQDRRQQGGQTSEQSDKFDTPSSQNRGDTVENTERNLEKPKLVRPLPFHKLVSLSKTDNDPDDVLFEVNQSRSGFLELVKDYFTHKNAHHILRLITLVIQSSNVNNLRDFLQKLLDASFLTNLSGMLNKIVISEMSTCFLWKNGAPLETFCSNISEFLKVLMSTLPSCLAECFGLMSTLKQVCFAHNIDRDDTDLNEVFELVRAEKQKAVESHNAHREHRFKKETVPTEPPDDFRDISIFPTMRDIQLDEAPFLRANKTKGKYTSIDTYLDIQFRLLREDYVQPLRLGISEYRKCIKEGQKVDRLRNVRIYRAVQILRPVCSSKGINHVIQFDTSNFKRLNWASSRRLLFGSLVCLSSDHFETVHYATVGERDPKNLVEGNLEVHFENLGSGILDSQRNDTFVMAETTAYFEAYRYILEGLQEMNDSMPLARYIIDCETTIKPPQYILRLGGPSYDFSCLLVDPLQKQGSYPVLNTRQWPSCDDLGLDTSQYQALQTAITKEFAIIQGPPGTGKTFVGLKITQLLLANNSFWKTKVNNSPILVVCFTNHALDQFLEGILNSCDGSDIVRIGARCKNEALEKFILRNKKKERKESKKRTFVVMQSERDCRAKLRTSERNILEISGKLKKSTTHLIPFPALGPFMAERHVQGLNVSVSEWLNFHPLGERSDEKMSPNKTIKEVWRTFILNEIEEITDLEKNTIVEVWELDLRTRAELYKSWQTECFRNISKIKGSSIQSVAKMFENSILSLQELIGYADVQLSNLQIRTLCSGSFPNDGQDVVLHWLYLANNESGIKEIKETIDSESRGDPRNKDDQITSDDLEEERALDDEDHDNLFNYMEKENDYSKKEMKVHMTDDEWVVKWNEKKNSQRIKTLLRSAKSITDMDEERMRNVCRLPAEERCNLYAHWLRKYQQSLKDAVQIYEKEFSDATESLNEVRDRETMEILRESVVMGMTTTGAAKYRKLLQKIQPQIIIVEEAAEVLESHIVTTLNANCKHLILIGDHKQLRPSTTVYELAKKFEMDISLFERMVKNDVPCVTLEEQHRMRPEISLLLKHKSLYPRLRDHSSVKAYTDVKGVDTNVYFISHEEPELDSSESTSYSNPHEAKYISALCRYFLNQGYAPAQITVITPYMGQVLLLRKEMPKTIFEGVRITAVDNFQGEENDIILLSLVRSSDVTYRRNPIGFVGIENRICVSLSRAKTGLFVLGNFSLLEAFSPMWADMISDMKLENRIGKGLTLRCANHPHVETYAQTAKDFDNAPEGGCKLPCGGGLQCGHTCPRTCHIVDMEHKHVTCSRPCELIVCKDGHRCTKTCSQKCGNCLTKVQKTVPMCRHVASMLCYFDPFKWKCKEKCQRVLPCGHICNRSCFECIESKTHREKCEEEVWKELNCGHKVNIKCHESANNIICSKPCNVTHDCGHRCSGTCGTCSGGRIHKTCKGSCGKVLPCGHKCNFPCSEICPPCSKQCEWKCSHGIKCKRKCFEACDQCTDKCQFRCKHRKCDNDCSSDCSVDECNEECNRILECSHACRSLCGEKCICVICNTHNVKNDIGQVFDETSRFIQLPDCKCIFEVHRLDRYMNQKTPSRGDLTKRCPHCQKVIKAQIKRYAAILKSVRKLIFERNIDLRGTESKRQTKIKALLEKCVELESNGLTKESADILRKSLLSQHEGSLHISQKKIEALCEVLRVSKYVDEKMKMWPVNISNMNGIMTVRQLQDVLLQERKYASRQFWREISAETSRFELYVKLNVVQMYADKTENANATLQRLLSKTIELLSAEMFDDSRQTFVMSVLKLTTSYLAGEHSTLSDIVLKYLAIRREAVRKPLTDESNVGDSNQGNHDDKNKSSAKRTTATRSVQRGDTLEPTIRADKEPVRPMINLKDTQPHKSQTMEHEGRSREDRHTTAVQRAISAKNSKAAVRMPGDAEAQLKSFDTISCSSDVTDEDNCASDFTGSIEIKMKTELDNFSLSVTKASSMTKDLRSIQTDSMYTIINKEGAATGESHQAVDSLYARRKHVAGNEMRPPSLFDEKSSHHKHDAISPTTDVQSAQSHKYNKEIDTVRPKSSLETTRLGAYMKQYKDDKSQPQLVSENPSLPGMDAVSETTGKQNLGKVQDKNKRIDNFLSVLSDLQRPSTQQQPRSGNLVIYEESSLSPE